MTAPRRFTELAAVAAAALFLLSWGAVHTAWYDDAEIVDTPVYERYGEAIEDGAVPYRDIRPEYPPGALPAFVVPALLSDDEQGFRDVFEWLMAAFGVATIALAGGDAPRRARDARADGRGAGLLRRVPAPARLGRADALRSLSDRARGRARSQRSCTSATGSASASSARRIAVKLFPAVLLPVALGYTWRRRGRREALVGLAICAAVVALVFLPFLVVAPEGVARSIGHQLSRPLQIESLGSALYLAAHHLVGLHVEMRSGHGSQNLHATGTGLAALLFGVVQLAVLVWIWLRRPAEKEELLRWSAAAVVAFVALGKVLSPQFLIWLAPLVPLVAGVRGLRASVLLAAALVLTQLWFPSRYWELARDLDPLLSTVVLAPRPDARRVLAAMGVARSRGVR